jgi:hypothetical protein
MTILRVVRGDATAEELAAVVALLAASGGSAIEEPVEARSLWARPQLRAPLAAPGPGTWVASGLGL